MFPYDDNFLKVMHIRPAESVPCVRTITATVAWLFKVTILPECVTNALLNHNNGVFIYLFSSSGKRPLD